MASGAIVAGGGFLPMLSLGVTRDVSVAAAGGASAASSALAAAGIGFLVVNPTGGSAVRYAIGENPTASATTYLMDAGTTIALKVPAGHKIAFLSNSATTTTVNVTDIL